MGVQNRSEELFSCLVIGNYAEFSIGGSVEARGCFAGHGVFNGGAVEVVLVENCLVVAHEREMRDFNQLSLSIVDWLADVEDFAVVVNISVISEEKHIIALALSAERLFCSK